ncbi:MAG: hypothetical protein U0414_31180 [Polyangiaceae bacterium]
MTAAPPTVLPRRAVLSLGSALAASALGLTGCDDSVKKAEGYAVEVVNALAPAVPKDFANVRSGLADGAKLLTTLLPTDAASELKQTRDAIGNAREHTDAIRGVPATFFVFTNTSGIAVRSEHDPDELAEKDLFAAFPALKKSVEGAGAYAETFGEMAEMRRVKQGAELEWAAAVPVLDKEGKPRGAFVAGWSFRFYATYLQNQGNRVVQDRVGKTKEKAPVMYTYIIKGSTAYGAQETPEANAEAVAKLDLAPKAKSGLYKSRVEIGTVTFAVAALPAPDFGDDAAIAVVAAVF